MIHFKQKQFNTTVWTGGKTTELYIFPEDSSYEARDFQFRLSTATVESENSEFTSLPGVRRTLMVLRGQMELIHENQYSKLLGPFDTDHFEGGWKTRSKGKCTDVNLMCRELWSGGIRRIKLVAGQRMEVPLKGSVNFLYVFKGTIHSDGLIINEGDLLKVEPHMPEAILAHSECDLIAIELQQGN